MGHFEPLGHYAEVHLLLEEGEKDLKPIIKTELSEDILDKSVDPIEALTFIRNNILLDSDWHNMSLKYAYDYINFEALYGLYWDYFDTLDYFERNPHEISNQTLHVEEILHNIFEECRSFINNFDKLKTKILT